VKIEEIKSKSESELGYELEQMKKELFEMRFKSRTSGVANPARIRLLKRSIARINTVLRERVQAQA